MITLEQEFELRKQYHMQQVVASAMAQAYKSQNQQDADGLNLPSFIVDEMAVKQGMRAVQLAMQDNVLEGVYLQAWEEVKKTMPDNYNSCQSFSDMYEE